MKHEASCSCGQLGLIYEGEITKTSICHCFSCQKRTGSAFGMQMRIERTKTKIEGEKKKFISKADSGNDITFYFCPTCGSTVFWENSTIPESYIVAAGAFADPNLPAPTFSVYKARKHHWFELPKSITMDWD